MKILIVDEDPDLVRTNRDQDVARGKELGADDYLVKPPMEYHFLARIARFAAPA